MFRSSTLVVAAVLGAGPAPVAGCERRMLDEVSGQLGGSAGTAPTGAGAGGSIGDMSCAAIGRPTAAAGLDVLLVVTASASMNWDATNNTCVGGCGATSKWAQATAAINDVVWQTQSTVGWGLKVVPEDRAGLCTVVETPTLAVPDGDGVSIPAALAARTSANGGLSNGGNFATRAAVEVATSHLSTLTDDNRKVIVLVTDGVPNCPPEGGDTDDGALAVQAIAQAAWAGFPTFVVGFAPWPAAVPMLDQMAVAGDTGRLAPVAFFPVTSTPDLAAALRTMVADSARCVFTIPPPPTNDGTATRSSISVAISGVPVPYDSTHTNGWDHTDSSYGHLQLYGPVCDRVLAAPDPAVTVAFHCVLL